MKNTRTHTTIATLRKWFTRFGVPVQLVSDNGPLFSSSEFSQFLQVNGIKHIRCSVYQPCSNGGAERFVQTVKKGLRACHIETGDKVKKLDNILLAYRVTLSSITGKTPSELFLGRQMRTRLDRLRPTPKVTVQPSPLGQRMEARNDKVRQRVGGRQDVRIFVPGQNVMVVNHVGKPK